MKDPAFLFYSDNFLSGTMFLSDEQVGKYIRLLCAQHLTGHLTENDMIFICKQYDENIFKKFTKDGEGKYYNERLEEEILRRKNYVKSRSDNKLGKTKKSKVVPKSYDKHMGNENGNENVVRKFNHLSINKTEFQKLIDTGFSEIEINGIFDRIENYKKNTSYKSLYLTSLNWLKEKYPDRKEQTKQVVSPNYWDQLKPEYRNK
jgi:uncharacterized protein YdaU (DUF1376 family)